MRWYVVNTHSGYEAKARLGLQETARQHGMEHALGEIFIPMEEVVEVKKGEKSSRERKFFPGYMLVQMELSPKMWHVVKQAPKIIGFIGGASEPTPLSEREVRRIRGQMEEGLKAQKTSISFSEGDLVKVIDGPFKNFSGNVEEVNADKQKVRVLVSIFGRATPVELDFVQVEPVSG
ncbi:MAG: transcription termination/antitermination factor NusG [Deltaproteobacteria bacterium]|nr:MAG: transcription termination/antitermination factor NusG [Deltaproteobacteria bacterium]